MSCCLSCGNLNFSIYIGSWYLCEFRDRLSKRPYLWRNYLRSTVADAMVSLADIRDYQIILDLTCGSSSILMQAAYEFKDRCYFLGVDISMSALEISVKNKKYLCDFERNDIYIDFINADVIFGNVLLSCVILIFFLLDFFNFRCVDHIISDLPFGQHHGTVQESMHILQRTLEIFSRFSRFFLIFTDSYFFG
ncbi:unnamed protein product [Dracunculus medinensis]|uniref:UPF0020 domain-containing protein n=1 Tax=Dracunculus medinensis TaxID=318479 RepID=A0A0N4UFL4_DRAME|nr:unnamed protein product [Dracunculus medinensis]